MAKPRNLQPQENNDNQLNESDRQVNKFNKFFSGSKSLDSVISRKLLIGLIIAFGILIFFLTTVNFDKIKTKSSFFGSQPPPPPPADVVSPPEPPDNVFDESNVYGETTASKEPPCSFTTGSTKNGYGDINGDGQVTNEDAGLTTTNTANLSSIQKKAGDVDGNGLVDFVSDGYMISQYVAGTISTFPVCANQQPTPTPSPISGKLPPCYFTIDNKPYGYGDINNDQLVTTDDVGLTINPSALDRIQKKAADVDANGLVDFVSDGYMISKYTAGSISTFPVCSRPTPKPSASPTPKPVCSGPLRIIALETDNKAVLALVGVQDGCNSSIVWVSIYDMANRLISQTYCLISNTRCSTSQPAPPPANYKVVAVADLDRDGRWYESGEYDVKALKL